MAEKNLKYIDVSENKKTGRRYLNFITPIGVAVWPKLVEPDEYKGKKSWKTGLKFKAEDVQDFLDEVQPFLDEYIEEMHNKADAKKLKEYKKGWTVREIGEEELDDTGEPTGFIILNFSKNFTDKDGNELDPPTLFDSFNQETQVPDIWSGSKLRIGGFLYPYGMASTKTTGSFGMAFKMQDVQIIELKAKGQGGSGGSRFGVVEGGFGGSSVTRDTEIDDGDDAPLDDDEEF